MFFSKLHSPSVLFYLQHPSRGWYSLHRHTLSLQMEIGPMELTLGYSVQDCFSPGSALPQLWYCMLSFIPAIWLFCSTGNTGWYWKKSHLYKGSSSLEFLSMPLFWSSSDRWHITKKRQHFGNGYIDLRKNDKNRRRTYYVGGLWGLLLIVRYILLTGYTCTNFVGMVFFVCFISSHVNQVGHW